MITPGVEIIHELPLERLLDLWPSKITDFGDAIIVSLGFQFNCNHGHFSTQEKPALMTASALNYLPSGGLTNCKGLSPKGEFAVCPKRALESVCEEARNIRHTPFS